MGAQEAKPDVPANKAKTGVMQQREAAIAAKMLAPANFPDDFWLFIFYFLLFKEKIKQFDEKKLKNHRFKNIS